MTSPTPNPRYPSPEAVLNYLNETGWRKVRSIVEADVVLGEVWYSPSANRAVIVPMSYQAIDYNTRMYQLLNDLTEVAGEPVDEALAALLAKSPH